MKAEIKKQQFITMRIEGQSFAAIAKSLSISKSHLVEWNKEADTRTAINEGLAIQLNDTVRTLEMGKQSRIAAMLRIYKKIVQELESRDLADVPTDKLIQLSVLLNQKINELNTSVEIGDNEGFVKFETGAFFNLNTLE